MDDIEMKSGAREVIIEATAQRTRNLAYSRKPRLERYLGFLPTIAFSCTLTASWETLAATLYVGLLNGGPVSLVYGMILSILGSTALSASLGEMASITPTAGAQYHWTFDFAPRAPVFLSLMQGWITVFAWLATAATAPFIGATQLQGIVILNYPTYVPERWHSTLIMWAVLAVPVIVNIYARRLLAPVEIIGGICHLMFLPAILVTLICLAPRSSASFVFTDFVSGLSGWSNDGVIWSLGLVAVAFPLTGFDGVLHMAEEVKNPTMAVPQTMVLGIVINGILTLGFLIGVLFTMGSYKDALETTTGYPIIEIFLQATKSVRASTALTALLIIIDFIALFGSLASTTRLTWAFARDRGLPFANFFSHVSPRHKIPLRALFLVVGIIMLLSLIIIGSTAAFNAIVSLSTLALYVSYVIPIVLLIIKRLRNQPVQWGPWRLGRWGLPINLFAVGYAIFIIIFLPFPSVQPVTWLNMNYAGPIFGLVLIFALVDWFAFGKKRWHGPTVKFMGSEDGT